MTEQLNQSQVLSHKPQI